MSTYAPPPTLPILHPPAGPSSTPLCRPPDALHRTHPQQCQQAPPPPSRMDPLDLLSRVALGQYPIPTEQESQPRATSTPRPSHPYPLQPFNTTSASPSHSSAHHLQYQHCDYSKTTPSYSHTTISSPNPSQPISSHQRHVCVADLSPVSSEDGLPAEPHHPSTSRPIPDMPSRHSKVMRSATDADVHKPRSQPSRFCHICSRTSKKVGLVACGNFSTGSCRKVICQKCFTDHQWNWEEASNLGAKWLCTHCRRECPERAQCAIYKRTNDRRREQQQQQKSSKGGSRSAPKSNGGD